MNTTTQVQDIQISELLNNCFKFSKLFQYRPKFSMYIENEHYILKTAEKLAEFYPIFKMRQQAFLLNDETCKIPFRIDIDEHDFTYDHIMILDKRSGRICGTYRMKTSLSSADFYSENEFELKNFLREPGIKLELGRACIHPDFRNGAVIDLLWRGIAKYAQMTNARYLFGCSSVKITDPNAVGRLMSYMKSENMTSEEYGIRPTSEFNMGPLPQSDESLDEAKKLLPPLLRSYLQAGSRVHGAPALDKDFKCIDLLTILDLRSVQGSYARRYFSKTM
jgi:putative hemolysin